MFHGRSESAASITHHRIEPIGFVSAEVEYQIDGTLSPYYPATREDPAEGGEATVTLVTRICPVTGKAKELPDAEWPFSTEEMVNIEDMLARAPQRWVSHDDQESDGDPVREG